MLNNLETKVLIINTEKIIITDDRTGQITELTKVVCSIPLEEEENFKGGAIFELYTNKNAYNIVSKHVFQNVKALIEQKPVKSGVKYKLLKINDIECK